MGRQSTGVVALAEEVGRLLTERRLTLAVAEASHALTGSAACIRARFLADLGRQMETRARAGDGAGAQAALPALEEAYRAVWDRLEPLAAALEGPA